LEGEVVEGEEEEQAVDHWMTGHLDSVMAVLLMATLLVVICFALAMSATVVMPEHVTVVIYRPNCQTNHCAYQHHCCQRHQMLSCHALPVAAVMETDHTQGAASTFRP
jgi:hypothetical protein